ncbi:DNA replication complex GINS family protein [Halorubrum depositum]|uniref:DNA replication complex GINS family protein n=1 Tax=Halorubrum depositum TaxID=2583992 RepID=UPI0011A4849F|nr:DNA replication complex GINS family protein [Halorubrum depositum]
MNLDELRSAQAKERRKDSLQHLRDSFYDDVAAYVADLRAARDRRAEQVDKPFSDDDVRRLSDEVETAEEVAEALYERRVGKVVKLASFAAADMPVDADGMTTEERELFDDLVERIEANKSSVLDVLSGEVSVDESASGSTAASASASASASDPESVPAPDPDSPDPADPTGRTDSTDSGADDEVADALAGAMGGADDEVADALDATPGETGGASEPPPTDAPEHSASDGAVDAASEGATTDGGPTVVPPEPAPPGAPGVDDPGDAGEADSSDSTDGVAGASSETDPTVDDRATVRITRDVGAIFGVDEREYDLASEDVVTLPVENAEPLVQRDAAERLD